MASSSVTKGASDWRSYRPFTLPNGVTCLAISDLQSKTTAASVCVDVGAASDPRDLSGLAHFTEHMCFLGSDKYPGENEYKRYLSCHGGRSNASTSMHLTTYKFDVLAEHAEGAFDIFSNFFVRPLFSVGGTGREINAVDSENSKNISTDGRRRLQILKAIADPAHYYSKFSTGHKGTLNIEVREALLAFHKTHYRPSNMVCVMVGPQSLDQLQEWITTRFANIQVHTTKSNTLHSQNDDNNSNNNNTTTTTTTNNINHKKSVMDIIEQAAKDAPNARYQNNSTQQLPSLPFNPAFRPSVQNNQWPILVTTLPLRSMRKVVLQFPLPSVQSIPNHSPSTFLSHLLGHEGPGSSFAALQDKGWIQSLSSGPRVSSSDQTLFQIDIGLTQKGEERWEDVVGVLFEHCYLIDKVASRALAAVKAQRHRAPARPLDNTAVGNASCTVRDDEVEALRDLQRIWNEIAKMRSIDFHQNSPGPAYSAAPNIAQAIMRWGTDHCLSAGSLLPNIDDDDVDKDEFLLLLERLVDFTNRLVPENCMVERCSSSAWKEEAERYGRTEQDEEMKENNTQQLFGLQKEKWYGVEYYLSPIDHICVEAWKRGEAGEIGKTSSSSPSSSVLLEDDSSGKTISILRLPGPNRYLPRTLELCPDLPDEAKAGPRIDKDIDPPELLLDGAHTQEEDKKGTRNIKGRLWHRLDDRYALPRSYITLLFRNASVKNIKNDGNGDNDGQRQQHWHYDETATIQSLMLTSMFNNAMSQEMYDADIAGAHWSLSTSAEGLVLRCGGYSDRLPNLALKVLKNYFLVTSSSEMPSNDDTDQDGPLLPFITEQYFVSAKDRLVRHYQSYLQSGRADAHAAYYINLLTSNTREVQSSLDVMETLTLDSLKKHHRDVLLNDEMEMECLFTGNVAKGEAMEFFQSASRILDMAVANNAALVPLPHKSLSNLAQTAGIGATTCNGVLLDDPVNASLSWVPGSLERRLNRGQDIELHFSSKNSKEENGAVQMIFQSPTPGFKGEMLSSKESLKFSSAIHLLCHMLREPLFDELRTKQQIGYVVSSYFDINFSAQQQQNSVGDMPVKDKYLPETTPIESIVINILSKKMPPSEVAARVDEFLLSFRNSLSNMPLSEIEDHATSLSTKLKKPTQKLGVEVSKHFGRIRRYIPEILAGGGSAKDLPWNSIISLANSIESLNRDDLLMVWDATVAGETRSRIVSCVYGKTFPLIDSEINKRAVNKGFRKPFGTPTILRSVNDLIRKRKTLKPYDGSYSYARPSTNTGTSRTPYISGILRKFTPGQLIGLVGVSLVGAGLVAMVLPKNSEKRPSSQRANT